MKATASENSATPRPNKHVDFVQQANSRISSPNFWRVFTDFVQSFLLFPTFQHNKRAGKNPNYHFLTMSTYLTHGIRRNGWCLGIGVLQYVCMCVAVKPVSCVFTTQFRGEFISTSYLLKLESTKMTFPVLLFDTL